MRNVVLSELRLPISESSSGMLVTRGNGFNQVRLMRIRERGYNTADSRRLMQQFLSTVLKQREGLLED
jgi:hypothetical protein